MKQVDVLLEQAIDKPAPFYHLVAIYVFVAGSKSIVCNN